jgi:aminopeptidase N
VRFSILFIFLFSVVALHSQTTKYSHADSLKGKVSREREWWNVLHYDLHVSFNQKDSTINGYNKMYYSVLSDAKAMQIDLMDPMKLDSAVQNGKRCEIKKDGAAHFVSLPSQNINHKNFLTLYFHGKPIAAKMPPWDGGLVWKKDNRGSAWTSIACQGMAAQVWFPNKDHQYDEPDSVSFFITASKDQIAVSNGRLRSEKDNGDGTKTWNWAVMNPINNYNIIPYIGQYVHFSDTMNGKNGVLTLDYWVIDYNLEKARLQFAEVKPMLRCFEDWFGPYPFYEDGYKLVEAPFLGMEHQSAVAYGNMYLKGYMGRDLSNSGWGLKWDFIIVHESGHEWFGNNITTKDVADSWVHEGFTSYSENLYTEYLFGRNAGADYVIGTRSSIMNLRTMISVYDVNSDGPLDKYYKGSNFLHTLRYMVDNDSLWKQLLRDMNKTFWHQTVTSKQIEDFMSTFLKTDLSKIFDQYLRTTRIPVFEYKFRKNKLSYRWNNCVKGFDMKVKIKAGEEKLFLSPTTSWQNVVLKSKGALEVDRNFYVKTKP